MDPKEADSPDSAPSRRNFLRWSGVAGFFAVTIPLWLNHWARAPMAAVNIGEINATTVQPPQSSSQEGIVPDPLMDSPQIYGLSLGGSPMEVFGFEGGEPIGRPSKGASGSDGRILKRVEGVQFRDIVLYYLPIPGAPINGWMVNSLKGSAPAVNGTVMVADRRTGQGSEVQFSGGFIRHIVFPEGDKGAGPHLAPFRITIGIRQAQHYSTIVSLNKIVHVLDMSLPRKGGFELSFQDFGVIPNVVRVESPTFLAKLIPASNGVGFQGSIPLDYSNLRFQLPEMLAGPFYEWHTDFVLKGMNGDNLEKKGKLRWLAPVEPYKPVLTLELEHLGILSIVRLPEKPGYVQVEMYCEKIVPEFT